jgi:16S rRNA (cytosine967-C5)-methyltransferase
MSAAVREAKAMPRAQGRWPLHQELEVVSRALVATLAAASSGEEETPAALPAYLHREKIAFLRQLAQPLRAEERQSQPHLRPRQQGTPAQALGRMPEAHTDSARVLREMAAGAMRQWGRLGALVQAMQARRTSPVERSTEVSVHLADALLRLGLHCLEANPDRAHRIVDQTVDCAKRIAPGSAGYINALLRRFGREREALVARVLEEPLARWNFPLWWIEKLQHEYPERWQQALSAAQGPSPLTLRVNRRACTREAYLRRLVEAGFPPDAPQGSPGAPPGRRYLPVARPNSPGKVLRVEDAIFLDPASNPVLLPGYSEGLFSVQDLAAQQAGWLLEPEDGMRVLDACAAPGGKTAHLLELADCEVHAWDVSLHRLKRAETNLQRLGLRAHWRRADLLAARGLPERPLLFERILLDAPCSASGIAGRHPEIRWRRQPGELLAHHKLQRAMLKALWPRLAPGGLLLYATCSVFQEEGREVVAAFAAHTPDLCDARTPDAWALLPCRDEGLVHDGFYYARLRKRQA